jgi:asparagine synthase (glutamine-hydrolysing)
MAPPKDNARPERLMCGIAAVASFLPRDWTNVAGAMSDAIAHRGPDDSGLAAIPAEGVALAMRRLSIVDLEGGHQPMWDEHRRICVVFNGEIYNCAELREQLVGLGYRFLTDHSDTEVLVHGYLQWGTGLFSKLNGMFAIALWDRQRRELVLARDRAGEKPLYLAWLPGGGCAVASEIKALLCHPDLKRELDPVALEQYLAFDYVIGPRTMLRGVEKLAAGHYAVISASRKVIRPYWSLVFERRDWDHDEAATRLDELMRRSIRLRLLADVPLGLFLSGGLDSTTIAYYMRETGNTVCAFSIAFEEHGFDETSYAQMASQHLGIQHHVETLSEERVVDLLPRITDILDEPMGDPAVIPTYLLSTFTRRHVKVALGGDGSDELLMGYRKFQLLKTLSVLDVVPEHTRRRVGDLMLHLPTSRAGFVGTLLRETPEHRLLSLLGAFAGRSRWILSDHVRQQLPSSVFTEPDLAVAAATTGASGWAEATIGAYVRGYLQEDILVKVDRASMAASLEVRAPFLDPDLMDFLATVSPSLKLRRTTPKYLLKQVMRGRIPDAIIDRPKHGFNVPLDAWFRGALRPLAIDRLSPDRVRAAGLLDPVAVTRLLADHLSGRADHGRQLWLLIQLDLWREKWLLPPALNQRPGSRRIC